MSNKLTRVFASLQALIENVSFLRRKAVFISFITSLCGVGNALADCSPSVDQVSFFVDANFKGACVTKGVGEYANSSAIGLPNDSISSIKVGQRAQTVICRDNNFGRDCLLITADVPLLSGNRVGNDQVSSAKVQPRGFMPCLPGANQASFFEDVDFQGKCVVKSLGSYPNSNAIGLANDTISSIRLGPNAQVVFCSDNDFLNDCRITSADLSNLGNGRVKNDTISSVKVQTKGFSECVPGPNHASLFMHSDYLAPCVTLGLGDYTDKYKIGLQAGSISSVALGANVHVCAFKAAYSSDLLDITANSSNLLGWNDKIGTLRVLPFNSPCRPRVSPVVNTTTPTGAPTITQVTADKDKNFKISGHGFLFHHNVHIRVADDALHEIYFLTTSDASGGLDFSKPIACNPGVLHFSANDERQNKSDVTGTLWSNTFSLSCP